MATETEARNGAVSDAEIRSNYLNHGAKTQIYRWYAFYENPDLVLENQLNLLTPDFEVIAGDTAISGRDKYAQYMQSLERPRTDAHDVRSIDVTVESGQAKAMAVDLYYINSAVKEDGSASTLDLNYNIELKPDAGGLPLFKRLNVKPVGQGRVQAFTPTYANQRMLSLVHYWMTLVERPDRSAEPFREILADTFALYFSDDPVTDFEGFATWIAGPASSIDATRHVIDKFNQKSVGDDLYEVVIDLDWLAIAPNGTRLSAMTRHIWRVRDDPKERFPRIQELRYEILTGGFD